MEYKYYKKEDNKCISLNNSYECDDNRQKFCHDYIKSEFYNDEFPKLNIFTIIKNEIINVLTTIKKHEYNKNLDSSIIDALFILYNSINNLNNSIKEEIDINDFNNKLDIYHIAPFLNIIRNNNIFYKIKLNALHSLDRILKYNSNNFNEQNYENNISSKQISYISIGNEEGTNNIETEKINKKDSHFFDENNLINVNDKHDENEIQMKINEKIPKKKYHFFNKNYKLNKKSSSKKEENSNFLINKGNNIINISIETLLNSPINYNNISQEEIILYDTIILFNNIICNAIKMIDQKNIIKIICYIFKIYKNNKYSLLFKDNCESVLVNIFYVILSSFMNNADHNSINDLLIIVLVLINNNKNKFVLELLKKKEYISLYKDLFENDISNDNMENINLLSFRLLNILLEICGCSFTNKNMDVLTNIIRCLFIHINSSSYILICKSMRVYVNIFILYKKHFYIYNEIFINILLEILKKNSSKNIAEIALLTISHFCLENVLFEIYYNYDINLYASDLLENFIQSILEMCVNFNQNTTIVNEVIFKMIKSILYISSPCKFCNNSKNNVFLRKSNNRVSEASGYESQLINDFRSDIYSNTYSSVLNSNTNENFTSYENKNSNELEDKKKKHKSDIYRNVTKEITEKINKMDSECFLCKNKRENQEHTENKKNNCSSEKDEHRENLSKKDDLKKSNMNKLYSLSFLTSIDDNRYINFCSILLFEYLKEYIKVQYIKKKKNKMRKKKLRKEILKKSANIFNKLKNKSIDELIKIKIIETHETFTKIDKGNYTIDLVTSNNKKNLINSSSLSYKEKPSTINEVDIEKERNDKGSNDANDTKNVNDNSNNITISSHNIIDNINDVERKQEKNKFYNNNLTKEINLDDTYEIEKKFNEENDNYVDDVSNLVEVNNENILKDENINVEKKKCILYDVSSENPNKNEELNNKIDKNKSDNSKKSKGKDICKKEKIEKLSKEESNVKVGKNKNSDHVKEKDNIPVESKSSQNNSKCSNINNMQKNLIEDEYFLKSITKFLRYNPFLDKEFIGEYISHRKNINILKNYVKLFDFCNLSLLSSLRLFLYYFKLPGEAQLIERILEHFSLCFFYSNPIHGDLDSVYKWENNKIVCLMKEEELANVKRYILIDNLNKTNDDNNDKINTHMNNNNTCDNKNNDHNKDNYVNYNKNNSGIDDIRNNLGYNNIQENINLKKNVDIKDYVHRNVYITSKKIQSMNEEEINKKYVIVENSDVIFILTYSIIMLNTDLHNNQVKNKMKLEEFIKNNRGINNGKNIDRIYLENLYNCILHEEIKLFSNTQNSYTNDDQYWKLLEKRKEQYKKYHYIKEKEVYFYKYDINKLIIKNNFLHIFFEIFKRTNDYNLTENCLCIFKMLINNFSYYYDIININKLCYIFKYINFYLTQKSQSLLYLFFYFVKKCHNLFRDCWSIYINIIFKLVAIDLVPVFFYPYIYINNIQFNNDKDFLNGKFNKGNSLETYNINKSITEIYQHPLLIFKKNVKKLNKSKWIDEFSNIFFSKNNNSENNNLSIIFKENYSEKIEEDKKKKKKKEEKQQNYLNKEQEKTDTQDNSELKKEQNDNKEGHDDNIEEDELNCIYVNIKGDSKNVDNSTIIDNINIYKRLKLDIYNFFTFNDFYNNMITNLNINSFVHLIRFLIIKCSFNKENEVNILNLSNKTELNNQYSKSQIINSSYLNNDKYNGLNNVHDHINDYNPVLVNSENSFDLFCCKKTKIFALQMFFHIMCFKINYTYVLYNILCKIGMKHFRKNYIDNIEINNMFEKSYENLFDMSIEEYSDESIQESKKVDEIIVDKKREKKKKKKKNDFNLSLNNIYDTDNSSNSSLSDSVLSDISNDSFIVRKNQTTKNELYLYLIKGEEKIQENKEDQEENKNFKNDCEFDKIYAYADNGEEEKENEKGENEETIDNDFKDEINCSAKENSSNQKCLNAEMNTYICMNRRKEFLIDKIKMDLYMKTYIMHLKIIVITFEHFFKLLNNFLIINYDDSNIFINIYNSIFKNYKMKNVEIKTEEDISKDKSYHIYDKNFEEIDKILNYEDEKIDIHDIENKLFLIKSCNEDTEKEWLFVEQLIMSIMNFSYICFNIYKDDKNKINKIKFNEVKYDTCFTKIYFQLKKKNKKFFFLCGIYLLYILQFLKKNILYRYIDKIIYVLEKISKNIYVNSCIINIYLHILQLITPNNILYKNTNNTNISLNDKDIYIYIEKATIYTESINNIINNNNVLIKLNNFNIENIILSLLPYLLFFSNKKEEINAHIASINSECLHIISNIYYKSIYMYMNISKKNKTNKSIIINCESSDQINLYKRNDDFLFDKVIELKKMYIFLLTCFVLSLACSFSSKKTRSEAYIKLQQFLFNENYIFKRVNKNEISNDNKNEQNGKDEKYVYRDEKLIDLISNFIILPLITYNYYFPFICKNMYLKKYNDDKEQNSKKENETNNSEDNSINCFISKTNYFKEALLNFNLCSKNNKYICDNICGNNEYENCGCIINYKNIETINEDLNILNNLFNFSNDYYIHTMLHKQYNYYFSYLFAKKMLSYDNVCYRKSMSISFVSHIILSFLYSLLNCSGEMCDNNNNSNINNRNIFNNNEPKSTELEKDENDSTLYDKVKNNQIIEEENEINLYELLCLNNEGTYNKIVTKTKCENNCIYYFLKHFYQALLTIKEEAKKILHIYKETFIENIKNIIYVSSSYAYSLKDYRINCFSHIKNGLFFLNEEEKNNLKSYNKENMERKKDSQDFDFDSDIFKNILKLQVNVRISISIVYYILYSDNSQNNQFKLIFEELLNVLLTKYNENPDEVNQNMKDDEIITEKQENEHGNLQNEAIKDKDNVNKEQEEINKNNKNEENKKDKEGKKDKENKKSKENKKDKENKKEKEGKKDKENKKEREYKKEKEDKKNNDREE
ncbi:protein transport protein SEC7, putative [Plasmodium gallinaceum]|uniref:Protein transport protein SEC7, putative n=1 Tax=Plasmodium gallinaceum TaxID=5849 RepID=A0A1J1GQD2_PLAGA|nr:protein transport protein SEC7, putative [Plasmodium gallinaceum]CRG94624.1 protein transport protein SEC7, putative [Plasmodium gallinaceum]